MRRHSITVVAGLAVEIPQPNADLVTWTVTLREGVRFSDGSVFDAEDVVAAYDAVRDPEVGSWMAGDYDMIERVTAARRVRPCARAAPRPRRRRPHAVASTCPARPGTRLETTCT